MAAAAKKSANEKGQTWVRMFMDFLRVLIFLFGFRDVRAFGLKNKYK
jgi:hypothetical protein